MIDSLKHLLYIYKTELTSNSSIIEDESEQFGWILLNDEDEHELTTSNSVCVELPQSQLLPHELDDKSSSSANRTT